MLPRIYDNLDQCLKPNKVLIIFGPRQVGKTTLLENYLSKTSLKYRFDTGDNVQIQQFLSVPDLTKLQEYVSGYDLIVIDEAQKVKGIGESLKLMVDQIPNIQIIATGSSSFELVGQVGEPLTGRKRTLTLYPVSQIELKQIYNPFELKQQLEKRMIYGCYPEVVSAKTDAEKQEFILEIMQSYLLKDILELEKIKSSKLLIDLLRMLAFQIGKEVSHAELAKKLRIDTKTVARYLDLLEKSFVLFNLRGYSRNLRKEIVKKSKYFFLDNGIRNAIIANFNPLEIRNDVGELWENFILMERLKKQAYSQIYSNNYFWRTWDGQEIDWIEEREGALFGYEIKWAQKKLSAPKDWLASYSEASFSVIHRDNYLDFVT